MYFFLLIYRQLGDNKPYTPVDPSESNNKRLYGFIFYRITFLGLVVVYVLDCHGLVCLYRGTIDLDTCQCQCQSYTSGKQCENLNCLSLPDECVYGNNPSLCTIYSNVPNECPKFCGLCKQYDEMKKYYDSIEVLTNIGIRTIKTRQSVSLVWKYFYFFSFYLINHSTLCTFVD
jgi:hypothetical protein